MTRSTRRFPRAAQACAGAALATLVLTGCGQSVVRSGAAAVIGDSRVSSDELERDVSTALSDPAAAQAVGGDQPAYQRQVLQRLITDRIVEIAAERRGVRVTPGQVDEQYAAIEAQVGADRLAQQAAAQGLTLAQVRDIAQTQARSVALGDVLTADVSVPPAALQQAYTAAQDNYDQVRTAQVQLPTLADAQALLPQAQGLSDQAFGVLASQRSTDEASKAAGGDLGYTSRGALAQQGLTDYATAAFAARVGDTFAVDSPTGGRVVRVLDRRTATLEQVTPALRRQLLGEQIDEAVGAELRATAASLHISVNPRFGRWDTTQLSVVDRDSGPARAISSPSSGPLSQTVPGEPAPGEQPAPAPSP